MVTLRTLRPAGAALVACALSACAGGPERPAVVVYPGYAAADGAGGAARDAAGDAGIVREVPLEGRVIDVPAPVASELADSRWRNLRRNLALFDADACEHCAVEVGAPGAGSGTRTDDEGYFRAAIDPAGLPTGWNEIDVRADGASGTGELLVVPAGNRLGIVSDVDDTVLVTDVGDRSRMLANTFLANPLQRTAVPGMAALYRRTLEADPEPEAAPLFYISASPRELQGGIAEFLRANDFPRGVLITKRITADRARDPVLDQAAYKVGKLDEVFRRLPDVSFVLVGDDGEDDPQAYATLRERYPDRVAGIWIRRVRTVDPPALPAGVRDLAEVLAEARPARP